MLSGRTAIVTGGSRGIGKAIALKLASMGANIVINYRNPSSNIEEILSEINNFGVKSLAVQGDVGNYDASEKIIKSAVEKFKSIDILINNAGITRDNIILAMKEKDFDEVINTNLKGAFNCSKHVSSIMLKQRSGKIINISSVVGLMGNPGQVNYSAAKAGIIGMTKTLAKEFGSRGITVNAIAPGFIQTDMTDKLSENVKEKMLNNIPLKRFGTPEDIANLAGFLSSSLADYITGQIINVDGGMI